MGFNPGPWNPHPGLSFWCVPRKMVCNLLSHIPCRKHMVVQGGKRMGKWLDSRWYWSQMVWHKTGMLQHCHLTHSHAITWPCKLISNNIWIFETHLPHLYMKYNIYRNAHKHAMKLLNANMQQPLIISKVQTCLLGSELSESNWVKFAAPSPPSVSTV